MNAKFAALKKHIKEYAPGYIIYTTSTALTVALVVISYKMETTIEDTAVYAPAEMRMMLQESKTSVIFNSPEGNFMLSPIQL